MKGRMRLKKRCTHCDGSGYEPTKPRKPREPKPPKTEGGLSVRVVNALAAAWLTPEMAVTLLDEELMGILNFGAKALKEFRVWRPVRVVVLPIGGSDEVAPEGVTP